MRGKKALCLGLILGASNFAMPVFAEEAMETFDLDPVVVTATRVGQSFMKVPADVTVLKAKDWEDKGAVTLADALEGVPGVAVSRRNGRSGLAIPYINGSDSVVLLIDGVRMNAGQGIGTGGGGVDLNEYIIDAGIVDRVEIVRGGGSVLYGADAIGGVIQVFTQKGEKGDKSSVGIAFGNDEQQQYKLGTSGADGKYHWRLNGSFYNDDGQRPNSYGRDKDISLRIDRDTAGGDLFLTYDYHNEKQGYPGYITAPSDTDHGQVIRQTFNFGYRKNDMSIQFYQNNRVKTPTIFDTFTLVDNSYRYDETLRGILYQDSHAADKNNVLTWGIDLRENKIENNSYDGNKRRWTQAYFLQDELSLGGKFTLTPGIRYEQNNDFGDQWLPKVGAVYAARNDLSLFANWGRVFKAPTFDALYTYDPVYGSNGNPDLKPEKGWATEIGVKKNFGEKHQLSLTYFKRDMKDAIRWVSTGPNWFDPWMPINVDSYKAEGAVLAWNSKVTRTLRVDLGYTYTDTDASTPVNEPQNLLHVGLHYENGRFSQSLLMDAVSRQDQERGKEISGYAIFNTSTRYKIAKEQEIYLNIYNLFDKDYAYIKNYPANGISFLVGWDMKF